MGLRDDPLVLRAYKRDWIKRRRAAWFAGKSCEWCGSAERLELDHIDPSAKIDHKIWSWTEKRREAEAAKCRVLCHDCHMGRHWEEMRRPLVHGTLTAYRNKRCRCQPCRNAHAKHQRAYLARKLSDGAASAVSSPVSPTGPSQRGFPIYDDLT